MRTQKITHLSPASSRQQAMTSQIVHELAKSGVYAQDFTAGQWSAIVNAAYACFTAGHVLGFKQAYDEKEV